MLQLISSLNQTFKMGCTSSQDYHKDVHLFDCLKEKVSTRTVTTYNYNETEIDISHFSKANIVLGIGGFGMVRLARKLTGDDKGKEYAMKSMSKEAILQRTSGLSAVSTELRSLVMLSECKSVCRLHYAFQNSSHLYMVLELAMGGDLRYNIRTTPKSRFSEGAARHIIIQIFRALDYCHKASILHRGKLREHNMHFTNDT
jgi:hypothetical protein